MPIGIQLEEVGYEVIPIQDVKILKFTDPKSNIVVIIPLNEEAATGIAQKLSSSGKLVVAGSMPTEKPAG
jgi:hypothetical protein